MAWPAAFVITTPLVVTEPATLKRTLMFGVGLPNTSLTVAVTQCWASTVFVSVSGVSTSVNGSPGVTVALIVCTARTVPSTTALTKNVYGPGTVGAVIVSWNRMSTGAVNGPYAGGFAGLKLMFSPAGVWQPAPETT